MGFDAPHFCTPYTMMTKLNLFVFILIISCSANAVPLPKYFREDVGASKPLYVGYLDSRVTLISKIKPDELNSLFSSADEVDISNAEYPGIKLKYSGISGKRFFKKLFNIDLDNEKSKIRIYGNRLSSQMDEVHFRNKKLYIIISCWDGYSPVLPLSAFLKNDEGDGNDALFATRDKSWPKKYPRSADSRWTMIPDRSGGFFKSPGPLYLVWKNERDYLKSAWPYQITGIFIAPEYAISTAIRKISRAGCKGAFNSEIDEKYIFDLLGNPPGANYTTFPHKPGEPLAVPCPE